ncbi:hypothetical protein HU200_006858 [Digitaria exilis]|uniref:Uncharacterized protein n=1 Tax=Digitaria exilis TaxID=1010633 RepID=A0A835KQF9_9POAL|nr:hypothetical protein HU200_006858 [Digitaria exilis]CAB3488744.1 unnamed protein product [Digitaria exilis]
MSGFFQRRRSSSSSRSVLVFLLLAATLLLLATCFVDGARGAGMAAKTRSDDDDSRPRPAMAAMSGSRAYRYPLRPPKVIPPSGPSEGHNSVGPAESRSRREEDRTTP